MSDFEQIAAGLDDVRLRGERIIQGHELLNSTVPFGAEYLQDVSGIEAHLGRSPAYKN